MGIFKRPLKFVSAKFNSYVFSYPLWIMASTKNKHYCFGAYFNRSTYTFVFNSVKEHKFGYKISSKELDFK